MSLTRLVFWLLVLMFICGYTADRYVTFCQKENARIMDRIEQHERRAN